MANISYKLKGKTVEVPLKAGEIVFGRGDAADHQVESELLSRRHFKIFTIGGLWYVEDVGSSNGTLLDSKPVTEAMVLKHGSQISAGDHVFYVALKELGEPTLVFLDAEGEEEDEDRFEIGAGCSIGRLDENDLALDDPLVSGRHCEITIEGTIATLKDLGSTNGTMVGGSPLTPQLEFRIYNGDIISLSTESQIRFEFANQPIPDSIPVARLEYRPSRAAAVKAAAAPAGAVWGSAMAMVGLLAVIVLPLAWFLPPTLVKSAPKEFIDAAPQESFLSFEDEGSLSGWSVYGINASVKAGLDQKHQIDGKSSLVISKSAHEGPGARVVMRSSRGFKLPFTGKGTMSLYLRGPTQRDLTVALALVNEGGEPMFLGQGNVSEVKNEKWGDPQTIELFNPGGIDQSQLEIVFAGNISTLWVDRIEFNGAPGSAAPASATVNGMTLHRTQDPGVRISSEGSEDLRVTAHALHLDGSPYAEQWALKYANSPGNAFRAGWQAVTSLRNPGELLMRCQDTKFSDDMSEINGASVSFESDQCGELLGITLSTKLSQSEELAFFDFRNMKIPVNRAYDFPVATFIAIEIGSRTLAFDKGVAIKIEKLASDGSVELFVTDPFRKEKKIGFSCFNEAVMNTRHLQILLREIGALQREGQLSAALERAVVLAGFSNPAFAKFRQEGERIIGEIDREAGKQLSDIEEAMTVARGTTASEEEVRYALIDKVAPFMRGLPGHEAYEKVAGYRDELISMLRAMGASVDGENDQRIPGLREKRPGAPTNPDELEAAEANAKTMLSQAQSYFDAGNWAVAYVLVDNITWNLHYTEAAYEARQLMQKIDIEWRANTKKRDDWVKYRIEEAESRALMGSPERAIEILNSILARYPRVQNAPHINARINALKKLAGD